MIKLLLCFIICFILSAKIKLFRIYFINLLIGFLIFEILIALMLVFPLFAKIGPKAFLRDIYSRKYRNIIQMDPEFVRYDPDLKYTLNPGTFLFHNPEFTNEFKVNSLGTRDDEDALLVPEIVVLGDSVPMGWGVNQNETYAKIIEKLSGKKVLNAAISSYSTVQAMRILDRVDTSKIKYLIVYYENWKFLENFSYFRLKDKFKNIDRKTYEKTVLNYKKMKRYFPMKYSVSACVYLFDQLNNAQAPTINAPPAGLEAEIFLYVLVNASHLNLNNLSVIVVCDKDFVKTLKEMNTPQEKYYIKNLILVAQPDVVNDCAYVLDEHPTAKWHRVVADEIIKVL